MDASREDNIYFARLAEQGERYEDMIKYMKEVSKSGHEMSNEERNLLSVAYKNSVGARRTAWRTIQAIQNKEETRDSHFLDLIKGYRTKIEIELEDICNDVLSILDKQLIPNSRSNDGKVFFLKMKGDYYRYLGEFTQADRRKTVISQAQESYK